MANSRMLLAATLLCSQIVFSLIIRPSGHITSVTSTSRQPTKLLLTAPSQVRARNASLRPLLVPVTSVALGWLGKQLIRRWFKVKAGAKFRAAGGWLGIYATIPLLAGIVNMATNQLAVWMIFNPLEFWGTEFVKREEGSPFGLFGWQGIVPSKVKKMGNDVGETLLSLLNLKDIFSRLSSTVLTDSLLSGGILKLCDAQTRALVEKSYGLEPNSGLYGLWDVYAKTLDVKLRGSLVRIIEKIQSDPAQFVDIKAQVVSNLSKEKRLLVELFQRCGRNELRFIVRTGLWGGALLGLLQMAGWLLYPVPWTLALGGALVGYATDWFALKILFEPVEAIDLGLMGLKIPQGLFLQRQPEVSAEFALFVTKNLLTPEKIWTAIATGPRSGAVRQLIKSELVDGLSLFLPGASDKDWDDFAQAVLSALSTSATTGGTHEYMQQTLRLEESVRSEMLKMKSAQFERVLHPIFQEDELTLILVGTGLGAISGLMQVPFY